MNSLLNLLHSGLNGAAGEIIEELALADAAAALKKFKHRSRVVVEESPIETARRFRTIQERTQRILVAQAEKLEVSPIFGDGLIGEAAVVVG